MERILLLLWMGLHDGRILPFIQQESTFWKKELWEKSKGSLIRNYKMAGDFQLWKNFANSATCVCSEENDI